MKLVKQILLEASQEVLDKKITNPSTGRDIKVSSALNYDDSEPVKKKALQLVNKVIDKKQGNKTTSKTVEEPKKNAKSHKPKSNKYGVSKECALFLSKKGFKGLNAYPQSFVKPEQIQFNPELKENNKNNVWICKFPVILPSGKEATKTAYTRGFMKKSQVKKYKKISKIKESDITNLKEKTSKLLKHKEPEVSDAACVLKVILETGLRIGSQDNSDTGNLGVRTLKKENVEIKNNTIKLNFQGKSYQDNVAEFQDPEVAAYLKKKIAITPHNGNLFSCSYGLVGQVMRKINPKGINPKDLRTYNACKITKDFLEKEPVELTGSPKEIKNIVKDRLKRAFEYVSKYLNNSPAMAKNSYVHPVVITDYLDQLGLTPQEVGYKHITLESRRLKESLENQNSGMDAMFAKYPQYAEGDDSDISEEDSDDCEEYPLPEWFYSDDWILVKKTSLKENKNPLETKDQWKNRLLTKYPDGKVFHKNAVFYFFKNERDLKLCFPINNFDTENANKFAVDKFKLNEDKAPSKGTLRYKTLQQRNQPKPLTPGRILKAYQVWNTTMKAPEVSPFQDQAKDILIQLSYKLKDLGLISSIQSGGHAYIESVQYLRNLEKQKGSPLTIEDIKI